MNLKINRWYCRLGNNIQQVKQVVQIALHFNYNVILPPHPFLNTTYIKINKTIGRNKKIKVFPGNHNNYFSKPKNINKDIYNKNNQETIKILRNIFKIKDPIQLGDNDVIIHIRSGDIFYGRGVHRLYVQPPLSYYVNIIKNNNFSKIIIVAEDKRNPVINKLLSLYPNIQYKKQNLKNDIRLILGCKHIVFSFGTFVRSILLMADNITNIYTFSYRNNDNSRREDKEVTYHIIGLQNYKKMMFPWKNTQKQRKIMLTYVLEI